MECVNAAVKCGEVDVNVVFGPGFIVRPPPPHDLNVREAGNRYRISAQSGLLAYRDMFR